MADATPVDPNAVAATTDVDTEPTPVYVLRTLRNVGGTPMKWPHLGMQVTEHGEEVTVLFDIDSAIPQGFELVREQVCDVDGQLVEELKEAKATRATRAATKAAAAAAAATPAADPAPAEVTPPADPVAAEPVDPDADPLTAADVTGTPTAADPSGTVVADGEVPAEGNDSTPAAS